MAATLERILVQPAAGRTSEQAPGGRLLSLDAYRGFIMLVLVSHGFGFPALKKDPLFAWVAREFQHVEWEGMASWDLIQPAFLFMVGMAMPFAFARRQAEGAAFGKLFRHAARRAFLLVVLSQVLISISGQRLSFQLINVLSQIAFTYLLCFLILRLRFRAQALVAALLLAGHWALFVLFPGPDGPFSKTGNIGAVIDHAVLGKNYSGYYVTINFLSSTVTTLFGAWAARLLMGKRGHGYKMDALAGAAAACFLGGVALQPFNPLVKRLWTASFTLASAGWVFLALLGFYWLVEVRGLRRAAFPLAVVGMNSIFIYSVDQALYGWLDQSLAVFTRRFAFLGLLAPVAQATLALLVMWYICYWFYRRKIFFKI